MEVKRVTYLDVIFVVACLGLMLFISGLGLERGISYILLLVFWKLTLNKDAELKRERKYLYAFGLVFVAYSALIWYSISQGKAYQLPVTLTIFLAYFFGVRYRDFKWSISLWSIILILLIWFSFELMPITGAISKYGIDGFLKIIYMRLPLKIYCPSIVEEVVFRGLLFSGLLSLNIREDRANIIQAVIFGLVHIVNYDQISLYTVLLVAPQTYLGFIFGKIYSNTKSLTPCIILHGLLNSI